MNTLHLNACNSITLTEESRYFGGMNLKYQLLLRVGNPFHHFYIRVEKDGEFDCADAGMDLEKALQYYQKIVFGAVTPCALQDVLADLCYA